MYDYYKALPEKELPDTVAEMQPLFSAVAHGCAAGLHQQVKNEVYWSRIQRENDYFMYKRLGAFSDHLAVLAHFFTTPWCAPVADLMDEEQAVMLVRAGFCLCALGRLREALEPMQAGMEMQASNEDWRNAAGAASNLSQLQLTLGDVTAAAMSGQQSVDYVDQSEDLFLRMGVRSIHAGALHQAGETTWALELFVEAEQIQQERQPKTPRLYSLPGFQYCDLLLAQNEMAVVLERYQQWVERRQSGDPLLDRSLEDLMAGRAHCQQGNFSQATDWLDQAIAGLREAGQQDELPRGLVARAALNRDTRNPNHDFTRARQDLQEVHDIAELSGMRLHLTDYHLEMARLLIAEQENPSQTPVEKSESELSLQDHITQAAKLIVKTGYKRRLPELEALQSKVAM